MASKPKFNSWGAIARREAERRGQGIGPTYIPWVRVQDRSVGWRCRIYSPKNGRALHALNPGDAANILFAEIDPTIIRMEENIPLCRKKSLAAAERVPVEHPMAAENCPIVLWSDLRCARGCGSDLSYEVICGGEIDEFRDWRTAEMIRLDEVYWKNEPRHAWTWRPASSLPVTFLENAAWVVPLLRGNPLLGIPEGFVSEVEEKFRGLAMGGHTSLAELALWMDKKGNIAPGTTLLIVRYLIAHRRWNFDLRVKFDPTRPIGF